VKDWKEQLKDVKRILRDAVHDRERDEKLSKVDFEPPKSRSPACVAVARLRNVMARRKAHPVLRPFPRR